ncbi:hypothetical protein IMSAGC007_01150 [Lachnospiraceae bacterium]|nr:hypothetical protein IMSAGC007_01150 [Lachnospiraceae bacterium]
MTLMTAGGTDVQGCARSWDMNWIRKGGMYFMM